MTTPDTDPRPRVPIAGKKIDLDQLASEVGAALSASDTEIVVADEDSPVTQETLQAALNAHIAPAPVDHDKAFRDAVTAATNLDALKAALLGTKGPGAEPRRPDGR